MPNQYVSDKKTIGELLSMTSPAIAVPDFQRDFSWNTAEVDTFWQDLLSFDSRYPGENIQDQEYFLGSVVLVNTGAHHLLLDGQQRLAISTILLSVIRDFLGEYDRNAGTRTAQKYISDFNDSTREHAFKLTLNRFDRDFFRHEVQEQNGSPGAELASHVLIRRARDFFQKRFEEKYQELGRGRRAFDWGLRVQLVLTDHVSVVAVSSADEDNAATVFETLNDRGIGLSTPDLLRNLLLRRVVDTDVEEAIEHWRQVLEVADEASVDAYLRHYWLSHRGDLKTRSLYREIKRAMDSENINALELSRDLSQAAQLYREIAGARHDNPEVRRELEGVAMLAANSLMPAILSGYESRSEEELTTLLQALITTYVRHTVIGNLETSRLETIVFNLAKNLREGMSTEDAVATLKQFAPADDQFSASFKTARVARGPTARYLLRELEHAKRRTSEVAVEGPDRVHVEHIYPRSPAFPRWPDHEAFVNRLGNQTLLARRLNTAIKNSEFSKKRNYYRESELLLTQDIAKSHQWDRAAVEARQRNLADVAVSIWTFPE